MRDIRKRRIIILILAAAAILLATGAYIAVPSGVKDIEIVTSDGERIEESYDVYIGETVQLRCRISPQSFAHREVDYYVSDEEILSVDKSGKLSGIKEGQTKLIIECAGVRKNVSVDVEPSVKEIKGLEKEITLYVDDEYQLKPRVVMAEKDIEAPKVTYKSKRTTVATVDNSGKVSAVGEGTTRITVKAGTETIKVKVTVEEGTDSVVTAPTPDNDSTASQRNKPTAKKKTKKSKESKENTKKSSKKKKTSSDSNDNGSSSNSGDSGSDNSSSDTGNNDSDNGGNSTDTGDNSTDTGDNSTDTGDNSTDTGDSGSDTGNSDSGTEGGSDSTDTGTGNTGSDSSSDPNSQTDADLTTDN